MLKEEQMAGRLEDIDSWLRHIWLKVVKREYDRGRILEESNLHSTVYPAPLKALFFRTRM